MIDSPTYMDLSRDVMDVTVTYCKSISLDPSHAMGGHLLTARGKHCAGTPLSLLCFLTPLLWARPNLPGILLQESLYLSSTFSQARPESPSYCTLLSSTHAVPRAEKARKEHLLHWTEFPFASFPDTLMDELSGVHQVRP